MHIFVNYSLLLFLANLTIASCVRSWSCNEGLLGKQSTPWKLCVKRSTHNVIQIKIVDLFKRNDTTSSQLLGIGFPRQDKDKFLEIVEDQGTITLKVGSGVLMKMLEHSADYELSYINTLWPVGHL